MGGAPGSQTQSWSQKSGATAEWLVLGTETAVGGT